MSIGDIEFSSSELSELAAYALAQSFPSRYLFNKSASMAEREKQRITSLNVYRVGRGLPTLPVPHPPIISSLPVATIQPLIDRVLAGGNEAASDELVAKGLPALLGVLKALAESDSAKPGRKRLAEITQELACTVREVDVIDPKLGEESEIAQSVKPFENKPLTTKRLFDLVRIVAQMVMSGGRPAALRAERDSDGTGFVITISFHGQKIQGGASILLAGKSIRGGGGGDASEFLDPSYHDDYLKSGIDRCIASNPRVPIVIMVDLAKP